MNSNLKGTLLFLTVLLSEEIINKQENKKAELKPDFKIYQNENIVFKHKIDPVTGEIIKESS